MKRFTPALLAAAAVALCSISAYADSDAARLAIDSARDLYSAGNWETATEAYEDALAKAAPGSLTQAEATIELASLLWEQGYYAKAHQQATTALKRAQALKLDQAVGRLMLTLGHIEASQGKLSRSENTLKVCVKSAEAQRDANFAALCRINLRFVRQLRGKSVGTEAAYRRDLDLLKRSGESVLVGTSLAKSAELQEKSQDFAGALNTLQQAQAQFVTAGSVPAQARNRLRLAQALQNLNRWDDASKQLDGLVLDFKNMKNRPSLVTAHALRGKQRAHAGDSKGALADYHAARKTAKSLGSPQLIANAELALCEFYALANETSSAASHCGAASDAFASVGIPTLAARAHILEARLAQANKQWLKAREEYLAALNLLSDKVAPSARDPREIAVQEVNLCQVEMQLKSSGAHRRCLDAEKSLSKVKANDPSFKGMVAATAYGVGVTAPDDQTKRAIGAFEKADAAWGELGNRVQQAEVLLRLGRLHANSKRTRERALTDFTRGLSALGAPQDAQQQAIAIQLGIQKGQVELALSKWKEARATLETLVGRASATGDAYSQAWGYSGLAQARLKTSDRPGAIEALKLGIAAAKKAKNDELLESMRSNLDKLGGAE